MRFLAFATTVCAALLNFAVAAPVSIGNPVAKCSGGGTRSATGTYDSVTGAVAFNITISNCVDVNGNTHNGTVTVSGNALPTAAASTVYQFTNLTYAFNTTDTLTSSGGGSSARVCTWTKNGTYDTLSNLFNGTIAKTNCQLTITNEKESAGILEHALKKATVSDGS